MKVIDKLIESARLAGSTQAKRGYGVYTQDDAIMERAFWEGVEARAKAIRDEVAALKAERDSALKNEKRYLWLKSRSKEEGRDDGWTGLFSFYPVPSWDDTPYAKLHGGGFNFRGDLDAAIDAAIAKAEGRTK